MKVNEKWLRKWVDTTLDSQQLAERLTMAGLEVDSLHPVAGIFEQVVVAKVLSTVAHPQADRLTLCEIDAGLEAPLKVVCGAANVRSGLKVALAKIGAILPYGLKIKETKLRGELSQGMLCSNTELGLSETSEGILELDEDAPIGTDLRDYLFLDDKVFNIDLTPNRADCFSVLGIAREIAANTETSFKQPVISPVAVLSTDLKAVHLQASDSCPYYSGRIISNINLQAKTPLWIRECLRRTGIRIIHPVVDILNYVMIELGQPLHAFDLAKVQGDIIVRFATPEEKLILLDNQHVQLNEKILVIADSTQALAIAGVIGGADSAVSENTCNIFLESAWFSPPVIAGVARQFGLFTEAAQRFERGVDPRLPILALERASALLVEHVGGIAGPCTIRSALDFPPILPIINFNPVKIKQLTGLDINPGLIEKIFKHLNLTIEVKEDIWEVIIPSYRFDLKEEVDLVEEVIRLYGYDRIPRQKMRATVQSQALPGKEILEGQLTDFFVVRGYQETISYSFVDPELHRVLYPHATSLKLLNPISSELSEMRLGMWPGLIASMVRNLHRQQTAIKFFELGTTFNKNAQAIEETAAIGGLLTGDTGSLNWCESSRKFDFFDAKGDLEALFTQLSVEAVFHASSHPALHEGKTAKIIINGQDAGWCGVLHPRFLDALDINQEVILFELDLSALGLQASLKYEPISKYPLIRRDLSLLVEETFPVENIRAVIKKSMNPAWLKCMHIFDVYSGEIIPEGKKSIAVALILQDTQRTLVDSEINCAIDAIIKALADNYSITLRD